MICVAMFLSLPENADPSLQGMALFESYDDACEYANRILREVEEEYGEDVSLPMTEGREMAVYANGNVTWRAYAGRVAFGGRCE